MRARYWEAIIPMKNLIARIMPKKKDTTERYAHADANDSRKRNKDVLPHEFVRYADSWIMNRVNM